MPPRIRPDPRLTSHPTPSPPVPPYDTYPLPTPSKLIPFAPPPYSWPPPPRALYTPPTPPTARG